MSMSVTRALGGRARIRTRLPTAIPGVSVRLRGVARYRVEPERRLTRSARSELRLVAVQSVYLIARGLTRTAVPGEDHDIGNRVSLALALWRQPPFGEHPDLREHPAFQKYPGLQVCARVRLGLSRADRKRVSSYHAERRLKHSEVAFHRDRLDYLLRDTATARAWWTDRHGISEESQEVFDRFFLPLLRDGSEPWDKAIRISAILASAIRRLENSSADYPGFLRTADALLRRYGQTDLADQLPGLSQEAEGLATPRFPEELD